MGNGKKSKSRRKQNARGHVFSNTIKTTISTNIAEHSFSLKDLLPGLSSRYAKLVSVGVQLIPYMTVGGQTETQVAPVFAQLRLGSPFVDVISGHDCPQKPPKLLSWVNPTHLKVTPINAFQRMPVSLAYDGGINLLLDTTSRTTGAGRTFGAVVTIKVDMLPQGEISELI